jgi:Domain of unknown function (DUF4131)
MRVFRYGERVRFPAKLRAPRNFRNPGAFDYRGYLADLRVVAPASTKTVRPRWAIISVGVRNTFGHPRLETLQRLEEEGVATYRTDLNGAVSFYLDGRSVSPQSAYLR